MPVYIWPLRIISKLYVLRSKDKPNLTLPVNWHCGQIQNACGDGDDGDEVVDGAIEAAKDPLSISHVNVVEDAVEHGHHQVRQTHVGDESIRNRPHLAMNWKANLII